MPVPYDSFRYLTNPRTEVRRKPDSLISYEAKGWWAQIKRNGSRDGTYVSPERQPLIEHKGRRFSASWNRHNEVRTSWTFDADTWEPFGSLKGKEWCVTDGELIDRQTKHLKDIHYLYDLLVYNGMLLTGTTYAERYTLLLNLWPIQREEFGHYVVNENLWIAKNYIRDFRALYDQALQNKENEGLVLKDPTGIYLGPKANDWMAKVRRD